MNLKEPGSFPARYAVTGLYGYVGSLITAALGPQQVVGLCRRPRREGDVTWTFESRADLAPRLQTQGVRVLIHAAWDMRSTSAAEVERVCVQGSRRLFEAADRAGVERIVFISTMSAFEGCRSVYGQMKLRVEEMVHERGGTIVRPGLIFGPDAGGAFGSLYAQVGRSAFVPVINTGNERQYLLATATLADAIKRAARGEFDDLQGAPLTLAHPRPLSFRELIAKIARLKGCGAKILPIPWWLLWASLRCAETVRLRFPFRSDSVISAVYANPHPDFAAMFSHGIEPLEFPDGLSATLTPKTNTPSR